MLLQLQVMPTYTTRASSYWNMHRSRRGGIHDSVSFVVCVAKQQHAFLV
uniref:Uncharacterized protein n=1 Tax=Triticum urartu TaxID=4572 RepID=A0A8R7UH39_TRIUA